jgi:SAM-dependent methyltransferase
MTDQELAEWFEHVRTILEDAYVACDEPWAQSGMSGPVERWTSLRKPIADCIDRSGTFLDIGCANGYLLECIMEWIRDRDLSIVPYGLDISDRLLKMASSRLLEFRDNLYLGNGFYWEPPSRFDYVRTELVYVPAEFEHAYIQRLRRVFLNPDGRLLIVNHSEGSDSPERGLVAGSHPTRWLAERLDELGIPVERYVDGYDSVRGKRVRVAVVRKEDSGF